MAYRFTFGDTANSMLEQALNRQHQMKMQQREIEARMDAQDAQFRHDLRLQGMRQGHEEALADINEQNAQARMRLAQEFNIDNMELAQEHTQENMRLADDYLRDRDYRLDFLAKERIRRMNEAQAELIRQFTQGIPVRTQMDRSDYFSSVAPGEPIKAHTPFRMGYRRATVDDALNTIVTQYPDVFLDVSKNIMPQLQREMDTEYNDLTTYRLNGVVSNLLGLQGTPIHQFEPEGFDGLLGRLFLGGDRMNRALELKKRRNNPAWGGASYGQMPSPYTVPMNIYGN